MARLLALMCLFCALAAPAGAQAPTGGAPSTPPPTVTSVACKTKCSDGAARAGSRIVLTGRGLRAAQAVTFITGASAAPGAKQATRLTVVVPAGAATGPVTVTDDLGQVSAPSESVEILETARPKGTDGPIATAVSGRKTFVDGARRPTLSYRLQTGAPARVTVTVVRQADRSVVATIEEGTVEPGKDRAVPWSSTVEGRYAFVVSALGTDGARASTARARTPDAFVLIGHKFPIRGRHRFGTGAAAFGGGRGHQGQDVFAKCGTPLVAARGGVVKMAKFQSAAGNYLVVDDAGEGTDTMYAHLRDAALVARGDRVRTGDPIGFVGDTGDANGCHLHFEEWNAPGWYTGGAPFDPLVDLKAWDALS